MREGSDWPSLDWRKMYNSGLVVSMIHYEGLTRHSNSRRRLSYLVLEEVQVRRDSRNTAQSTASIEIKAAIEALCDTRDVSQNRLRCTQVPAVHLSLTTVDS